MSMALDSTSGMVFLKVGVRVPKVRADICHVVYLEKGSLLFVLGSCVSCRGGARATITPQ